MDGLIEMDGLIYGIFAGAISVVLPSLIFFVLKAFRVFIDKFI